VIYVLFDLRHDTIMKYCYMKYCYIVFYQLHKTEIPWGLWFR